jgi:hypothetical protein
MKNHCTAQLPRDWREASLSSARGLQFSKKYTFWKGRDLDSTPRDSERIGLDGGPGISF